MQPDFAWPRPASGTSGKSKHRRTGVVKFRVEHVLSERRRRSLKFRRRECEQSHDIPLRLWRKHVEVLLDHRIALLAGHPLEPWIDDSDPNGGGVVAVGLRLLKLLHISILDHPSFESAFGFPRRRDGC